MNKIIFLLVLFLPFIIFVNFAYALDASSSGSSNQSGVSLTPVPSPTVTLVPAPTKMSIILLKIPTISFPASEPTALANQAPSQGVMMVPTLPVFETCNGNSSNSELSLKAPSKLDFPDASISSLEQWTDTRNSMDIEKNPITIKSKSNNSCKGDRISLIPTIQNSASNQRVQSNPSQSPDTATVQTGTGWVMTVSVTDMQSKDDIISADNIYFLSDKLVAEDGASERITLISEVRFLLSGTPYLFAKADEGWGEGVFSIYFHLRLRIPPQTPKGDYETRMELTII